MKNARGLFLFTAVKINFTLFLGLVCSDKFLTDRRPSTQFCGNGIEEENFMGVPLKQSKWVPI